MELKPRIGIGNLKFGMSQKEIFEVLGSHDRKKVDDEDEEQLLLEFYRLKLRLTIYLNEKFRLGYIRTSSPNLKFNGHVIVGSKIEFAKKEIFGGIIDDWEIEEYDFFTAYSNEDFWLTLEVEYGVVINVEIGVPFTDEDEYNWPD